MKIVHFSDSHAGGSFSGCRSLFDKRLAGFVNYCLFRKNCHDQAILDLFCEKVLDIMPDLVVCSGDITSTGHPSEFDIALRKLEPILRNSQIRFLYVPGNHDKYVDDILCREALSLAYKKINGNSVRLEDLPVRIRIGECEFILADETATTNIFSSCGYLRREDASSIAKWCEEDNGCPKVLIGHFPIIEQHPFLRFRKRLWGQRLIARYLRERKISLSLFGHVHKPYSKLDAKGRGEICAGSITKYRSFELIEYYKDNDVFTCHRIFL